jgi:hypothetical protein
MQDTTPDFRPAVGDGVEKFLRQAFDLALRGLFGRTGGRLGGRFGGACRQRRNEQRRSQRKACKAHGRLLALGRNEPPI